MLQSDKGEDSQTGGLAKYVSGFRKYCLSYLKKTSRTDTWFPDLEVDHLPTPPHFIEHQMTTANDNLGGKKESLWGLSGFSCYIRQQYLCSLGSWSGLC